MENTTLLKEAKKQFSRVGLTLFLGSLLIYATQNIAMAIAIRFSAVTQNTSLFFISYMLPTNLIAYPLVMLMFKKVPLGLPKEEERLSAKKMPFSHILIAFCLAYAGTFLFNLAGSLITVIIGAIKQSPVNNVVQDLVTSINPPTLFIFVVIFAPVMEELLFRKLVVDRILKYGETMAILFSGLLFGFFHGNLNQFCYAFFLGSFFSFLYIRTRNILYPILLHAMLNFFSGFLGSFVLNSEWMQEYMLTQNQEELINSLLTHLKEAVLYMGYIFFIYAAIIAGFTFFFIYKKELKSIPREGDVPRGMRFKTMLFNPGMILFCLLWTGMIILQLMR
ncbi:MAG: CPBP family intramembrane metalloprotease [Lachnospiraceae bacterium]|nr:CPBP family intramembrane metalloprotease [Lachnospiraceae bacterium]